MKVTKKNYFTYLILFLLFFFFSPKYTYAEIGLSIEPAIIRVQVKPGKAITKIFTVENRSSSDRILIARLIPFNKSDLNGNPNIDVKATSPHQRYFSLSNTNIKLNEPFTLKSQTKEQIVLSLSIPENANVEDFYTTLLVSTYDNVLPGTNAGTTIGASIGANLLITITPDLNPKTILKVNNFKITSQNYLQLGQLIFVDSLSPITFQASVYNEGNHITETKGTVTITKKQETLSVQGLLPQYVLSKNSRQLLNQNGSHIFIFKPNFLSFGRHQINIHVKSDNTNTQNSQDLIVVPIKIALGLLLLFFLLKFILKKNPKIVDIDS